MRYEWRGSFHHQTRRIPADYIFSSRHKCKFGTGQCEFLSLGMAACDNSNKLCNERMVCGSNFGTSCVQSPNRSINRSSNTLNLHDLLVFRHEDAGLRLQRTQGIFDYSRICLKTAAKVSLTRTNSAGGSAPSFRATQDFSMVASFSMRTTEGSFKPALCQSERTLQVCAVQTNQGN